MSELYHNRVLELAAQSLPTAPLENPEGTSLKVSRLCGSRVSVALTLDEMGEHITAIAVDAQACALGQAAAAILAEHAIGAHISEIIAARDALRAMLKESGAPPEGKFWELRHLQAVADYPPRHASTLLAFDAAVAAIEAAQSHRKALAT